MAALLFHVFEQRVLITLVLRERRGEREKRKGLLHVMVGLREKIEMRERESRLSPAPASPAGWTRTRFARLLSRRKDDRMVSCNCLLCVFSGVERDALFAIVQGRLPPDAAVRREQAARGGFRDARHDSGFGARIIGRGVVERLSEMLHDVGLRRRLEPRLTSSGRRDEKRCQLRRIAELSEDARPKPRIAEKDGLDPFGA